MSRGQERYGHGRKVRVGPYRKEDLAMACRNNQGNNRGVPANSGEYLALEMVGKMAAEGSGLVPFSQVLVVAGDKETLHFLELHMDQVVRNVAQAKKIAWSSGDRVDEGPQYFEKKIETMLEILPDKWSRGRFEALAISMKKALLLISLDRFHGNWEMICRVLGISRGELDREMRSCGIVPAEQSEGEQGKAR
jgi:hypothetical protein